jgi:curved DNA-binding protein CbpA
VDDNEDIYKRIARELSTSRMDEGLWTRALAEADGNVERCKAIYIRIRHDALVAQRRSPEIEAPISSSTGEAPPDNALRMLRWRLKRELANGGNSSLYSVLNVPVDCGDGEIRALVAKLRAAQPPGTRPEAELQYAMDTLGDPDARAQYDRTLLRKIGGDEEQPEAGLKRRARSSHSDDDTSSNWLENRKGLVLVGLASILILGYLVVAQINSSREAAARQEALRKEQELREKELALKEKATERVLDMTERRGEQVLSVIEQEQQRRRDQQDWARRQAESARNQAEEQRRQANEERRRQDENRQAQYAAQMEARKREEYQRRLEAQQRDNQRQGPSVVIIGPRR